MSMTPLRCIAPIATVILAALLPNALAQTADPFTVSCGETIGGEGYNGVLDGRIDITLVLTDTVDLYWDATGSGPQANPTVGIAVLLPNGELVEDNAFLSDPSDQDMTLDIILLEAMPPGTYTLIFEGSELKGEYTYATTVECSSLSPTTSPTEVPTATPTTAAPTTAAPTTASPTTAAPTTAQPTRAPTTASPTTTVTPTTATPTMTTTQGNGDACDEYCAGRDDASDSGSDSASESESSSPSRRRLRLRRRLMSEDSESESASESESDSVSVSESESESESIDSGDSTTQSPTTTCVCADSDEGDSSSSSDGTGSASSDNSGNSQGSDDSDSFDIATEDGTNDGTTNQIRVGDGGNMMAGAGGFDNRGDAYAARVGICICTALLVSSMALLV